MAYLALNHIRSSYIDIEHLHLRQGELMVVIGPSGAGKTSLLNIIAGFLPHGGNIELDQRSIESVPANRRNIGYLFQQIYLFPHLSVYQNLKIALRKQKLTRCERRREIHTLLQLFRIEHLSSNYPEQLSGGEKQRVAIARTIAARPKLLLLDEPFSHLDYKTARYLQNEFKSMQKELQITTLFVTHNLEEGKDLSDRIAVMEGGTIVQLGKPDELWFDNKRSSHHFIEKPNILEGHVCRTFDNGLVEFRWNSHSLLVVNEGIDFKRVTIWPEDIQILAYRPSDSVINCIKAELVELSVHDHTSELQVQAGDAFLKVVIDTSHFLAMSLHLHDQVYVLLRLWCLRAVGSRPEKAPELKRAANTS